MKKTLGCIRRADERFGMINDDDKLLIGVSGGKDSVLLLYAMSLYRRFCKNRFELFAVTLDLGLSETDYSPVAELCRKIDVPYEVLHTDIGKVVFEIREESNPCALCAKLRRGAMSNAAIKYGCNKILLGHNREDVLETLFLSLLYEGRINTFSPITYLDRKNVTIVRPMVFLPERDIISVVRRLDLPVVKSPCPVNGVTKRAEMRTLIDYMTKLVPDAPQKMINALANTDKYNLWDKPKLPPDYSRKQLAVARRDS